MGRCTGGQIDKYFINPKGWSGVHEWSMRGGDLLDSSDLTYCQMITQHADCEAIRSCYCTVWMMTWSLWPSSFPPFYAKFSIRYSRNRAIHLDNFPAEQEAALYLWFSPLAQRQLTLLSKQRYSSQLKPRICWRTQQALQMKDADCLLVLTCSRSDWKIISFWSHFTD